MKPLTRATTVSLSAAAFVAAFAGTSLAAGTAGGDEQSLLELLRPVLEAWRGGDYAAAGALALVVIVAAVRRYGSRLPYVGPYLSGSKGPAWTGLLVMVGAFAASLGAALTGPATLTLAVVWASLKLAAGAAGGYTLIKLLVVDLLLRPLRARLPGRVGMVIDLVLWIFDNPGDPIKKAETAAAAAVAVKPGPGVDGIVGEPREL